MAFQAVTDLLKIVEIAQADKNVLEKALLSNFNDYEDAVQMNLQSQKIWTQ